MFNNLRAYLFYMKALKAQRNSNFKECIHLIKSAIELNPYDFLLGNAYALWGDIEYSQHKYGSSCFHFEKAIKIAETNPNQWSKKNHERFITSAKLCLSLAREKAK